MADDEIRRDALADFSVWLLKTHGLLIDEALLSKFGAKPEDTPDKAEACLAAIDDAEEARRRIGIWQRLEARAAGKPQPPTTLAVIEATRWADLEARLRLLEDFRRAYDAWAAADEQTAGKLFDEMLESRETLK